MPDRPHRRTRSPQALAAIIAAAGFLTTIGLALTQAGRDLAPIGPCVALAISLLLMFWRHGEAAHVYQTMLDSGKTPQESAIATLLTDMNNRQQVLRPYAIASGFSTIMSGIAPLVYDWAQWLWHEPACTWLAACRQEVTMS